VNRNRYLIYIIGGSILFLLSCTNQKPKEINNLTSFNLNKGVVQKERASTIQSQEYDRRKKYDFSKGLIPDKETAEKIAEIIFVNIYGEKIKSEKPFVGTLVDGNVWFVRGSLDPKYKGFGGVASISICKKDGRILRVYHGK